MAGRWVKQYEYKSFSPAPINHEWTWDDPRIHTLLEQATQALGELNAFSLIVPDVDLFIQMHIVKEASTFSRIEGTRTEIDKALKPREMVAPERMDDWQEVQNYIKAMNQTIDELERLPLSNRLLKNTHGILLEGVRGEGKLPGEFRKSQNWIGLMSDLEKFLHNDTIKETFEAILSLRREVEQSIPTLGRKAENAGLLLNHLYRLPLVTPNEVSQILNMTHQTASSLIRDFEKLYILKKWEKVGRNQGYVFGRYLALFLE